MANFFHKLFTKSPVKKNFDLVESLIPPDSAIVYAAIISRVIPYYNKLNEANGQRFLNRVYNFRKIKSFHFQGMEPSEEAEILISAAAIQVSFGLKNYLLPYFKEIYII